MAVRAPAEAGDVERLLARRRTGVHLAFGWWAGLAVVLGVPLALLGWWTAFAYVALPLAGVAVVDLVRRSWTTARRAQVVRSGPRARAWVTRHQLARGRAIDLEVAGLWPDGVVRGQEPPLSVRVESADELPDGGEVLVHGELRPGAWVVLQTDDELVWPRRRVAEGLRPRVLRRLL